MATIFLSYRRSDGPQACRVYDWLVQRFGRDTVFMDVNEIPFAVSFPEFIKTAVGSSKILIALIGADWIKKIHEPEDPVRLEVETALAAKIPFLPVLIGNTPMPAADDLPKSIAMISYQNALTVGILHDFDTHMRSLVPKIETILGRLSQQSLTTANPEVVLLACQGIISFMQESYQQSALASSYVEWQVFGTANFQNFTQGTATATLYLHRILPLADVLELHFILSFWSTFWNNEHTWAGWVLHELERTSVIPDRFFSDVSPSLAGFALKIRRSDEDPRHVWQMITNQPLRLSLAYVAGVSPKIGRKDQSTK